MDKWLAFKNYLHNELGITKDDIRQWMKEAAEEQGRQLAEKAFAEFNIDRFAEKIVRDKYGTRLREDISREIAQGILKRLKFVDI